MLRTDRQKISILDQLREQGVLLESPCSGRGLCGKCRVRILEGDAGPVTPEERRFLSQEELEDGIRLACMTAPAGPLAVDPLELLGGSGGQVLGGTGLPELPLEPAVSVRPIRLDEEKMALGSALASCLPGDIQPGLPLLRALGQAGADGAAGGALQLVSYMGRPLTLYPSGPIWGLAVDIGTTTAAAALVDLTTGRTLGEDGFVNPQKAYGLDVLSRIHYTLDQPGGLRDLQRAIADGIQVCAEQLCRRAGGHPESIFDVSIAGNSTMIHALLAVPPGSLSRAPFNNVFSGPVTVEAGQLGLRFHPAAMVCCLPAVSAYIGGDIVAGALACGLDEGAETVFFVDIGTNGEMILRRGGRLAACSCAAGPALEGMNISCGMRAAPGAVERVVIRPDGSAVLGVIGGGAPKGLCGSGLLDAVSQGVACGLIQKSGRIARDHPLAQADEAGRLRIVLAPGLYLTQMDIRQVQLCKGAILSGCLTLMERLDIQAEEIDRVLVAGQFGRHLSPESLTGAGLLPGTLGGRISYVGNSAHTGALMCLRSAGQRARAERLAREITYVELSTWPGYEKIFAACMTF